MLNGPIGQTISSMTLPLLGGIYAMITFTLADTYFVAKLGTTALTAISYTFPVAMVLIYFIVGVGVGTASVVARAIGEGTKGKAARFATDGLILSVIFIVAVVAVGLTTIDPLFRFLGAEDDTIAMIRDYMSVWYIAIAFFIVSMVSNNIIRATGDAKFPGLIMGISAVINLILDPILIFGYLGLPAYGIKGAAIATLIAFSISAVALLIKQARYHLITFQAPQWRSVWRSWREILYIGVPSGLTNVITYIALAFIMKLLSTYEETAVAGFGVAIRIEELALAIFHAMNGAIAPFVGQNWGAKYFHRIHQSLELCIRFCLKAGFILAIVLALIGGPLARIFDRNETVVSVAALYMLIVPISYMARGTIMMISSTLNALGKPIPATVISFVRTFVLYVPLAIAGKEIFGIAGIFTAALLANTLTAVGTYYWNRQFLKRFAPV